MDINKKMIYVVLLSVMLVGSAGYFYITKPSYDENKNIDEPEPLRIETLTIGTISEDAVGTIDYFQPTADYVAEKLSNNQTEYKGKVVVSNSIENESNLLSEQKLDLYIESPLTAAVISKKSGAVSFLRRWKYGVAQYHSIFFVRKESSIRTLDDIVGKTIAFEDPASTSGYFLPKAYLAGKGFNVSQSPGSKHIRFVFSGSDENTPLWVIGGKADAGVTNNVDFEMLPEPIMEKLRVIDITEDIPRHLVSHRSGLDPALVERIKQILLDMDKEPKGIAIMNDFERTTKYDELSKDEISNISRMLELKENGI